MKLVIALAAAVALATIAPPAAAQQNLRLTGQYPVAALEQGLGGTVGLDCLVASEGRVECTVTSEMPGDVGFGQAALDMSREWRLPTEPSEGAPAAGSRVQRAVQFLPGPPPSVRSVLVSTALQWEERPEARDFARHYPEGALLRGVSGRVVLDCIVNAQRRLDCMIASETPAGYGFGRAALRIAERFRMAPETSNGDSTIGGRVRIPIRMDVRN